ncbi:MAG TPA: hypothetical protein VLI39_01860 [Sedimentisphaerales bacterium]|nr:hypothetical protein [Sedimentisphaerales bacterium]
MSDRRTELLELPDRSGASLHALLTRLTLRRDVAEELMQDLFLRLSVARDQGGIDCWYAYARRAGRDVYALWNMSDRTIRIRPVDEEEIEVIQMSDEVFARGQQRMAHATGLVALDEIANLPDGSTWEKVDDPNATAQAPGTQVYDLVWTEPVPTIPPTRKTERFRFFVDPQSHLPSRFQTSS